MASVHIRDIQRWLAENGQADAVPGPDGMFVEIRFDDPEAGVVAPDIENVDRVLTVDAPQGIVTIVFDANGMLRSLDIS